MTINLGLLLGASLIMYGYAQSQDQLFCHVLRGVGVPRLSHTKVLSGKAHDTVLFSDITSYSVRYWKSHACDQKLEVYTEGLGMRG